MKAQTSTEFIIYISFAIVTATIVFAFISHQLLAENKATELQEMGEVAENVANEIHLASIVEEGYSRTFELPDKINGKRYSINLTNRTLVLKTDSYEYPLLTDADATGTVNAGENNISNIGGGVNLNQ